MTDQRESKGQVIPEQVDLEWLDPKFYLSKLAPELLEGYIQDSKIFRSITEMQNYAYNMVRYSISLNPRDSMSIDPMGGKTLINPETGDPFNLEELGIDRSKCIGTTTSASGRYPMVAEVAVALYRGMNPEA